MKVFSAKILTGRLFFETKDAAKKYASLYKKQGVINTHSVLSETDVDTIFEVYRKEEFSGCMWED